MFCTKCGNKIEDNSKFCDVCGEKIETSNAIYSSFGKLQLKGNIMDNKYKKILIILCAILVLFLFLGGKYLFMPAYERPVAYYMDSLKKQDFRLFKKTLPKVYWEALGDDSDARQYFQEICRTFPRGVKVKCKVINKYPISADEINLLKLDYRWQADTRVEIAEGYELELEYTINGMKEKDWCTVVKMAGKWYMDPNSIM